MLCRTVQIAERHNVMYRTEIADTYNRETKPPPAPDTGSDDERSDRQQPDNRHNRNNKCAKLSSIRFQQLLH